MAYAKKWKPSRTKAKEFAQKMDDVQSFCDDKGISYSRSMDSFYFFLAGKHYRVSNHSVEASNHAAFSDFGTVRDLYHPAGRTDDTIYIHASKTRIIDIYMDIFAGHSIDGHGNRID